MKSVFIIAIAVVLFIPTNVFGEEITVVIDTEKNKYFLFEPIIAHISVDKYFPNSPITVSLYDDDRKYFTSVVKLSEEENKVSVVIPPNIITESGIVNLKAVYGSNEDPFGIGYSTTSYDDEPDRISQFILDNYLTLTKFDIGADWKESYLVFSPRNSKIPENSKWEPQCSKNINVGWQGIPIYCDKIFKKDFPKKTDYVQGVTITLVYYENANNPRFIDEYYNEDISISDKFSNFKCGERDHITNGGEIVICDNGNFHVEFDTTFFCSCSGVRDVELFRDIVLEKITSNPITSKLNSNLTSTSEKIHNTEKSTFATETPKSNSAELPPSKSKSTETPKFNSKLASFVDPTKDPQSYINRYNNEPKYKEWFDENYPQYSSIEEAVGLTLTEKIPSWVKNIFGWYAQDQVSEDELLNAIKYLIVEKILIVD